MKNQRFYNFAALYNKIAFSDITQEYVRILCYIPKNILVCADSIIPDMVWETPTDYFDKKDPENRPVPSDDFHCRKLFAEVDFSEIKARGFDKYLINIPAGATHTPMFNYDLFNSAAEIELREGDLIFRFYGAYCKNGNFDTIENHAFVKKLTVCFKNVTSLSFVIRSGSERVKKGAGIFPKETVIDTLDKAKTAEFLSSLKSLDVYYVSDHSDGTQWFTFVLPSDDRLDVKFAYERTVIKED